MLEASRPFHGMLAPWLALIPALPLSGQDFGTDGARWLTWWSRTRKNLVSVS
jgi:hypothetical protein